MKQNSNSRSLTKIIELKNILKYSPNSGLSKDIKTLISDTVWKLEHIQSKLINRIHKDNQTKNRPPSKNGAVQRRRSNGSRSKSRPRSKSRSISIQTRSIFNSHLIPNRLAEINKKLEEFEKKQKRYEMIQNKGVSHSRSKSNYRNKSKSKSLSSKSKNKPHDAKLSQSKNDQYESLSIKKCLKSHRNNMARSNSKKKDKSSNNQFVDHRICPVSPSSSNNENIDLNLNRQGEGRDDGRNWRKVDSTRKDSLHRKDTIRPANLDLKTRRTQEKTPRKPTPSGSKSRTVSAKNKRKERRIMEKARLKTEIRQLDNQIYKIENKIAEEMKGIQIKLKDKLTKQQNIIGRDLQSF